MEGYATDVERRLLRILDCIFFMVEVAFNLAALNILLNENTFKVKITSLSLAK